MIHIYRLNIYVVVCTYFMLKNAVYTAVSHIIILSKFRKEHMSWTVISVSTWRLMVMLVVLISSHNRWHCSWLSGIWELRGRKARDSRLATNDRSRDVMNYLERLVLSCSSCTIKIVDGYRPLRVHP